MTEGGRVNRVSVAVLVDGNYAKNDKGEPVYQPRDKEEIDRIAALVRTAIGFDQKRGDQVEVVNLRFADVPSQLHSGADRLHVVSCNSPRTTSCTGSRSSSWCCSASGPADRGAAIGRRIISPEQLAAPQAAIAAALAGGDVPAAMAAGATVEDLKAIPSPTAKMIDIAQVQGQVHAQSVQKVGELADKNPSETVSIIRSWLHESAA